MNMLLQLIEEVFKAVDFIFIGQRAFSGFLCTEINSKNKKGYSFLKYHSWTKKRISVH